MEQKNETLPEWEKDEIAWEMGLYDRVKAEGWKNISSKDCGNIVKNAIRKTEMNMIRSNENGK